jgi:hypothetical protein
LGAQAGGPLNVAQYETSFDGAIPPFYAPVEHMGLYSTDFVDGLSVFQGRTVARVWYGSTWLKIDLVIPHSITGVVVLTYSDFIMYQFTISYLRPDENDFTVIEEGNAPKVVFKRCLPNL